MDETKQDRLGDARQRVLEAIDGLSQTTRQKERDDWWSRIHDAIANLEKESTGAAQADNAALVQCLTLHMMSREELASEGVNSLGELAGITRHLLAQPHHGTALLEELRTLRKRVASLEEWDAFAAEARRSVEAWRVRAEAAETDLATAREQVERLGALAQAMEERETEMKTRAVAAEAQLVHVRHERAHWQKQAALTAEQVTSRLVEQPPPPIRVEGLAPTVLDAERQQARNSALEEAATKAKSTGQQWGILRSMRMTNHAEAAGKIEQAIRALQATPARVVSVEALAAVVENVAGENERGVTQRGLSVEGQWDMLGRAEGAREVLRRVTGGKVPEVAATAHEGAADRALAQAAAHILSRKTWVAYEERGVLAEEVLTLGTSYHDKLTNHVRSQAPRVFSEAQVDELASVIRQGTDVLRNLADSCLNGRHAADARRMASHMEAVRMRVTRGQAPAPTLDAEPDTTGHDWGEPEAFSDVRMCRRPGCGIRKSGSGALWQHWRALGNAWNVVATNPIPPCGQRPEGA